MENKNWSYYFFKDEFGATGNTREKIIASCTNFLIKQDVMLYSPQCIFEPKPSKYITNTSRRLIWKAEDFDRMAEQILGTKEVNHFQMQQQQLIGIVTHSVNFAFNTCANLDLSAIVENIVEAEVISLDRRNKVLTLKLANRVRAIVHSNGKVYCSGADSEETARRSARFLARILCGKQSTLRITTFKILNVLATGYMPWDLDLEKLYDYKKPFNSLTSIKINNFRGNAQLEIFETGAVNVWTSEVGTLKDILNDVMKILQPYSRPRTAADNKIVRSIFFLGNLTGGFDLDEIASKNIFE